jgi:hypothetical protein
MKVYAIQDAESGLWYKPAYRASRRWQKDSKRAKLYTRLGFAKSACTGIAEREPSRKTVIVEVGEMTLVIT